MFYFNFTILFPAHIHFFSIKMEIPSANYVEHEVNYSLYVTHNTYRLQSYCNECQTVCSLSDDQIIAIIHLKPLVSDVNLQRTVATYI